VKSESTRRRASARTHSGPYLPKEAVGLRVESRLVEVPVVVRDSHGHTLKDLLREDFEVYDAGKKREIATHSVQGGSRQDDIHSPAGADAGRNAANIETKEEPRFVALVFDEENMGFDNMSPDGLIRSVDAAVRSVREGLAKGGQTAVFSLSQGSVSPLATDASTLIEATQSLRIHRRLPPPDPLNRKTAVGALVDEPSPSVASVWSNSRCRPFGEMRGS
jgi:hypothetical protein